MSYKTSIFYHCQVTLSAYIFERVLHTLSKTYLDNPNRLPSQFGEPLLLNLGIKCVQIDVNQATVRLLTVHLPSGSQVNV
jgi:hypothetical protein